MGYFSEVSGFQKHYKLGILDWAILYFLYPVFKMHHWFYYGSIIEKNISRLFFSLLPSNQCLKIQCYSPSLGRKFSLPIWFVPDHLTSLLEIFWNHSYKLEVGWTPICLVDAGANIGYSSLYLATQCGVKRILAIEANSTLIPKLKYIADILKNHSIDLRIADGALVGQSRTLVFEVHENSRDSSMQTIGPKGTQRITIQGYKLTEWQERLGFSKKDLEQNRLFKIDVEGAEYEIIEQDKEAFLNAHYLIAEVHGAQDKRNQFASELPTKFNIQKRLTTPACDTVEVLYASQLH